SLWQTRSPPPLYCTALPAIGPELRRSVRLARDRQDRLVATGDRDRELVDVILAAGPIQLDGRLGNEFHLLRGHPKQRLVPLAKRNQLYTITLLLNPHEQQGHGTILVV